MKKSLTKKFIISILTVAFAVVSLGTSTFAWFSMNNSVEATGMQVKAATDSALVIATSATTSTTATTTVAVTDTALKTVRASTCDAGTMKYLANAKDVDPATGTSTAELTAIDSSKASTFYNDYIVYIASAGGSGLTEKTLSVSITPTVTGTDTYNMLKAVSVAFYKDSATTANYLGKVAVAEGSSTLTGTFDIGTVGASSDLVIVMRVYIDGALTDGSTAFVKSSAYTTASSSIAIKFTAS